MNSPTVDLNSITRLGRQLDPKLRSNQVAIGGAALIAALASLVAARQQGSPSSWFIAAGGAGFLSWAVARELDPDHPASAGLAMVLSVPLLALGRPSILLVVGALMAVRMMAGTVGGRPTIVDVLGIMFLAGVVGARPAGFLVVLLLAVGFVVAEGRNRRAGIIASGIVLAGILGAAIIGSSQIAAGTGDVPIILVPVLGFALISLSVASVGATTDVGDELLSVERVRLARAAAVMLVGIATVVLGSAGLAAVSPVAAALVATGFWRLRRTSSPRQPKRHYLSQVPHLTQTGSGSLPFPGVWDAAIIPAWTESKTRSSRLQISRSG